MAKQKHTPGPIWTAELIATAPEMLEVLKHLVATLAPHPEAIEDVSPAVNAAWTKARAAIAKAEGRS